MSNKSHLVLKKALERIQRQNPKFSIRALSMKVGVSHVFMGKILKGLASIPSDKIPKLIKALSLDDIAQLELREAVVFDAIKEKIEAFPIASTEEKLVTEVYEDYPQKFFSVLDHWYDLPILDLLTCKLPDYSSLAIAKSLGLTSLEVEASLEKSGKLGLCEFRDGRWYKTTDYIRFPATAASQTLRQYYEQVLGKVGEELRRQKPENYAKRSITNISFSVNPAKIADAKARLQKAMYDISTELGQGEATEVYHLTACLIPLSDRSGN